MTVARARSAAVPTDGFRGRVTVRTAACAYVSAVPALRPSGRAVVRAGGGAGDVSGGEAGPVELAVHGCALAPLPGGVVVGDDVLVDPAVLRVGQLVRVAAGRLVAGQGGCASGPLTVIDLRQATTHEDGAGGPPAVGEAPVVAARLRRGAIGRLRHGSPAGLTAPLTDLLDALSVPGGDPGPGLDRLIGLGPGLTPSGDDVVVGVLAALAAVPDALRCPDAAWRLADALPGRTARTTMVGRFYLDHAAGGRFGAALLDARDRLLADSKSIRSERAVGMALTRLLAVGASSGSDMLIGMVSVLDRWVAAPSTAAVAS